MSEAVRKLAARVLRAEIAARRPKDVSVVEDVLAPRLRLDPASGDFYVVDTAGTRDDSKTLETLLNEVVSVRPELFGDPTPRRSGRSDNPFAAGPGFNLTKAMALMKSDPDTARRLEAEAQERK